MKEETKELQSHLFICTHSRDEGNSCGKKNSDKLVTELKSWVKAENLKSTVKVTRSGCLGMCENGIAAVCYPQKKWITEIDVIDVEQLKKLLK